MKYSAILPFCITIATIAQAQDSQESDTLKTRILAEITVVGRGSKSDIHQLPQIVGTNIYAGKKSSLIVMDNVQGNVVSNTMRQVAAKIPGIYIWESEGSGIQIGISARGLSPNRSWEFNVRQNGYEIAADPLGYPEAYYNPQLQAVQRIEIVRGHGALQYGSQIGGMINYILKNGSEFNKPFQFETFQTAGSNGLFNTYNAVGGKTKKLNYYTFFDYRRGDGWRNNDQFNSGTISGTFTYKVNERLSLTGEVTRWSSTTQQPGGLTDAQFKENAQQSLRARNWFNFLWVTSAVTADYRINNHQRINVKLYNMYADRNSVGFNPSGGVLVNDVPDLTTGEYGTRVVDVDNYRNFGMEVRYLMHYKLGSNESSLSAGTRFYRGNTYRYRGGVGSQGSGYDISLQSASIWPTDIDFTAGNAAFFVENLFQVTNRLTVVPGIRYEYISAKASGYSGISNNNLVYLQNQSKERGFLLAGIGTEYSISKSTTFYANATQSYRPVQFADLTTPPTTDVVDPTLTDAKGLNMDVGYRGNVKDYLKFDFSGYWLNYDNRIGTIKQQRQDGTFYNLRTNIGNSTTKGVEVFGELNITKALGLGTKAGEVSLFGSYAYSDARYGNFFSIAVVNNALVETNYRNKRIEYAPENIFRSAISYSFKNISATIQQSYTASVFTDANNTVDASANGQNGKIPSYRVYDLTVGFQGKSGLQVKSGINNLSDERYFTRRAGGYPGPGVLPADGRTFFVTVGYVLK